MGELNIQDLLSAYLDGELNDAEAARVEAALAADPLLSAELDAMRAVDSLFKVHAQAPGAPADLADGIRNAVHEGQPAGRSSREAPSVVPGRGRLRGPLRMGLQLAAAAAIVVVTGLAWQMRATEDGRYPIATAPDTMVHLEGVRSLGVQGADDSDLAASMADATADAVADAAEEKAAEAAEELTATFSAPTAARTAEPVPPPPPSPPAAAPPAADLMQESAPVLLRAAPATDLRVVDDVTYSLREGRWTPPEYAGEALTAVPRTDSRWIAWTEDEARRAMREWPEAIVVAIDGEWIEIAPMGDSTGAGPVE